MQVFVHSKEEFESTIKQTVEQLLKEELPYILRKAKQKDWINTNELIELTGWSRRKIQYLRKKREIPFYQEGRRILYKMDEIEDYFRSNKIEVR